MLPLAPGMEIELDAGKLRNMSLTELKTLAQQMGISLQGLEDRTSALFTRIMSYAHVIEEGETDEPEK